jgi:hypothetical protein
VAEGQILFQRCSKNPASIAVSLPEPVLNLAARHASAETWKHISGMANTALGSNEKARYHTAWSKIRSWHSGAESGRCRAFWDDIWPFL